MSFPTLKGSILLHKLPPDTHKLVHQVLTVHLSHWKPTKKRQPYPPPPLPLYPLRPRSFQPQTAHRACEGKGRRPVILLEKALHAPDLGDPRLRQGWERMAGSADSKVADEAS
eukprot:747952-Hanusia_phi.AAC.2